MDGSTTPQLPLAWPHERRMQAPPICDPCVMHALTHSHTHTHTHIHTHTQTQVKEDGINISDWMQSLARFTGAVCRKWVECMMGGWAWECGARALGGCRRTLQQQRALEGWCACSFCASEAQGTVSLMLRPRSALSALSPNQLKQLGQVAALWEGSREALVPATKLLLLPLTLYRGRSRGEPQFTCTHACVCAAAAAPSAAAAAAAGTRKWRLRPCASS